MEVGAAFNRGSKYSGLITGLTGVLLGGSWVVISGVISPLIWAIIIGTLPITLLITTHQQPFYNFPTLSPKP